MDPLNEYTVEITVDLNAIDGEACAKGLLDAINKLLKQQRFIGFGEAKLVQVVNRIEKF